MSWLWCLSWRRIGLFLVYFYGQFADEYSLHVDRYVWDMVSSRVVIFLVVIYKILSRLSGSFIICNLWKKAISWLEFRLFKLIVSITVFEVRYVRRFFCHMGWGISIHLIITWTIHIIILSFVNFFI